MIKIVKQAAASIVTFENVSRFNAQTSLSVKQEIIDLYNDSNVVIINLLGIKFVDSAGFGAFISILKTAKERNGRLLFCNISREVQDLFEIMQLHIVFELFENLEGALASC